MNGQLWTDQPTTNQTKLNARCHTLKHSLVPPQLNWCSNFSNYPPVVGYTWHWRSGRPTGCPLARERARERELPSCQSKSTRLQLEGRAHLHHWTIYTPQFIWLAGGGLTSSAVDHSDVTHRACPPPDLANSPFNPCQQVRDACMYLSVWVCVHLCLCLAIMSNRIEHYMAR